MMKNPYDLFGKMNYSHLANPLSYYLCFTEEGCQERTVSSLDFLPVATSSCDSKPLFPVWYVLQFVTYSVAVPG